MTDKTDKDVEAPANEVPIVPRDARADALALLSEDERAALEIELDDEPGGDDDDDDEPGAQPAAPAAASPATAAAAPAPAAEPAPATPAASADEPSGDAGTPAAQPAAAPVAQAPVAAPVAYELPDDFADQRKALDEKFAGLDERLDAGDITSNEYARELRTLTREEAKLDAMQTHADLAEETRRKATEAQRKAEEKAWDDASGVLVAEAAKEKIDGEFDYANNMDACYQLGSMARTIMLNKGVNPDVALLPQNEKVDVLRQARRLLYYSATGKTLPTSGGDDADAAKKAAADKRRVDVSGITPPVSSLPGAGGSDGEEAEFSAVMELEGEAFDNAVANMRARSPEKYARFMATT